MRLRRDRGLRRVCPAIGRGDSCRVWCPCRPEGRPRSAAGGTRYDVPGFLMSPDFFLWCPRILVFDAVRNKAMKTLLRILVGMSCLGSSAIADGPVYVQCVTPCGGTGPRPYAYDVGFWVNPVQGIITEFTVGTNDLDPTHYSNMWACLRTVAYVPPTVRPRRDSTPAAPRVGSAGGRWTPIPPLRNSPSGSTMTRIPKT